jgi:hypothetical protein
MPIKELLPGTIPNNSIFPQKKKNSLHLSLGLQLARGTLKAKQNKLRVVYQAIKL